MPFLVTGGSEIALRELVRLHISQYKLQEA